MAEQITSKNVLPDPLRAMVDKILEMDRMQIAFMAQQARMEKRE